MQPFIEGKHVFFAAKKQQLFEQISHCFHENGREMRMALRGSGKFVAQAEHNAAPTQNGFAFLGSVAGQGCDLLADFGRDFIGYAHERFKRNNRKNFQRRGIFVIKKPAKHGTK